MDLKVISILLVLLICSISNCCSSTKMSISKEEDMEFERQLKILNKQPVKTIQTNEGDIIDCVDIYNQPAFDHPMLKNHKLQLRPSSFPVDLKKPSSKLKSIKLKSKELCPSGTVPIKRTQKEDLIRVKSLSEQRPPINIDEAIHFSGSHTVDVIMKDQGFPYYGATAMVTTYNLSIALDQASSTNMWIQSGPPEKINIITTGWKVSHQLNGDNLTRLFTYWTGDGFHKTGCYNTFCPGFVQTNKEYGPNVYLLETSTRGGPIYVLKLLIFQDRQTGNWWLAITEEDMVIGYFPKEIFSHLGDGTRHVAWGGISNAGKNGISPPMGNGYFPNSHYNDTCSFIQVQFVNDRNITEIPKDDATNNYVDKSGCFGLINDKFWVIKIWAIASCLVGLVVIVGFKTKRLSYPLLVNTIFILNKVESNSV